MGHGKGVGTDPDQDGRRGDPWGRSESNLEGQRFRTDSRRGTGHGEP